MDQRLSLINLFVDDVDAAKDFYRTAFGWEPGDGGDGIAFYQLGGVVMGLLTPAVWAKEGTRWPRQRGYHSVNFSSRDEVSQAFAEALAGGARSVVAPAETHWGGFTSYVEDPWGNLWELAHNPFWILTEDGHTLLTPPGA